METALDSESLRPTFWSRFGSQKLGRSGRSPLLSLRGFPQLEDNLQSLTKHPHWKNEIWFLNIGS
uniref:Uncharacterized protein n=1 Tax=Pongo abelii TaxID=9601 RepID=A0A8I5T711_PONAB